MKNCPYCNGSDISYLKFFSKIFNRCLNCDLIYRNKDGNYRDVLAPYFENYFNNYSIDQTGGTREKLYHHIFDLIDKKLNPGKILDVGTGCGFFLLTAQKRGWQARGIDPSPESVYIAKTQHDLDLFEGTLQEYNERIEFDAITLLNVLDHSAEPWREIEKSKQLLKSGGLIFIRFPNGFLHYFLFRLASAFGLENKAKRFLVFHQFSFTQRFIKRLLSDMGFYNTEIINSIPTEGDPHHIFINPTLAEFIKRTIYLAVHIVEIISFGKIFWGTSLEVMAIKK